MPSLAAESLSIGKEACGLWVLADLYPQFKASHPWSRLSFKSTVAPCQSPQEVSHSEELGRMLSKGLLWRSVGEEGTLLVQIRNVATVFPRGNLDVIGAEPL